MHTALNRTVLFATHAWLFWTMFIETDIIDNIYPLVHIKRKKMGDFIEPGTHRSTDIKVKIETLLKKWEMYFSYCIESKDFIYAFSSCSVK